MAYVNFPSPAQAYAFDLMSNMQADTGFGIRTADTSG
jgi:hypothetical protein